MQSIDDLLTRGVGNILPNKEKLEKLLHSKKKLNIYLGIDPTSVHIHLGHAVPLRKLQLFSQLGHNVFFLIGDFTALIGDTSDKDSERPVLTYEEIKHNFETYKKQAERILDFSRIEVRFNSEWLKELGFSDILRLTRYFSLNDFISRELIRKRLGEGRSVSLPEVLYPVMQGYDSYYLNTDIQLGGTDQTFNMQAGRTLQKNMRGKESFIISNSFLTGTDGRKMSKSWGNAIWLDDIPNEMYGKVMSIKDELIIEYFTLGTDMDLNDISLYRRRLEEGENPINIKKELARVIVTQLHGEKEAKEAKEYFEKTIQNKQIPDSSDIEEANIAGRDVISGLVISGLAKSKSEAIRLLSQSGVKENGILIKDQTHVLSSGRTLSVGRRFKKIV
jgi:tyrosyl-tRNA synthetase